MIEISVLSPKPIVECLEGGLSVGVPRVPNHKDADWSWLVVQFGVAFRGAWVSRLARQGEQLVGVFDTDLCAVRFCKLDHISGAARSIAGLSIP